MLQLEGVHVGQDDLSRSRRRAKSSGAIAGSGNRPTPSRRRSPRWRKAPTTSALARSLPRRPSPNYRADRHRRIFGASIERCSFRFSASVESSCTIFRKLSQLAHSRVVIVSGLAAKHRCRAATRAPRKHCSLENQNIENPEITYVRPHRWFHRARYRQDSRRRTRRSARRFRFLRRAGREFLFASQSGRRGRR